MKVIVNSKEIEFEASVLSELLQMLDMPTGGFAVAVGDKVIPRTAYPTYTLQECDQVTIIRATQGG